MTFTVEGWHVLTAFVGGWGSLMWSIMSVDRRVARIEGRMAEEQKNVELAG